MRVGAQGAGETFASNAAAVEDDNAVRDALRFVEIVGAEEDRPVPRAERHDERPQRARGLGIERGGGLVEQEHRRVVHQATRDRDLLLHAARERAEADVETVG